MSRVDTGNWGSFAIGDLFSSIVKPSVLHSRQVEKDSDGIPYIVRSKFDNGMKMRVRKPSDIQPNPAGVITFGAENTAFFYQPEEFVSGRDIYYIDTRDLSENVCLFLVTCLRPIARKYSYNYGLFPNLLKRELIKLPLNKDGAPDWENMGSLMQCVSDQVRGNLSTLHRIRKDTNAVVSPSWVSFRIGDLFELKKGTRLTRANMRPGNIPFIGAANVNNGVTAHISNNEHIHPAGTLTVAYNGNGGTGKTFYQSEPFWASDDVHVLYPKFDITIPMALFIAVAIEKVGRSKYGFTDKWKLEYMKNDAIMLPAIDAVTPDWEYMDTYMSEVMLSSETGLENLSRTLRFHG